MSYVDSAADLNAKQPDPSTPSSDYESQVAFWNMVDAILGGEAAIKAGRELYLPKFAKEKDAVYQYRLQNSPFTAIYSDISKNLASKPFSEKMRLKEGSPDQYEKLSENIDGQGNNLHVFCSTAFKSALDKAIHWILVDQTNKELPEKRDRSQAEEKALGIRPYWVHVTAQQMPAVYSSFVDGVEVIHHARIREDSKELDGFKEKCIERIREYDRERELGDGGSVVSLGPATWKLWEKHTAENGKVTWVVIDSGSITIGVIPLVPVILTKRCAGWVIEPALRDLAYMQIAEYRQEANLEWVKVMTCFPMLCIAGMATDDKGVAPDVTVGPNTVLFIPQNNAGTGPAGSVSVIEPGSQSIAENRTQLELTRKEMRDLGMQPLALASLTVTLSANISKKASSSVQAWVFLFKDAIEQALKYTAMWLNDKTYEPEVVIHTDFAIELETGKELEAISSAESRGVISKKTERAELKRRHVISNDVSDEQEQQRIAEEQIGLEPEQPIDPVTGKPVKMPARLGAKPPVKPAPVKPPATVQ